MKFKVRVQLKDNLTNILRDIGYRLHPKYEDSYIKRLSGISHYPRWHIYVDEKDGVYEFNLHIDQKKASYEGQTAHSGDYDDDLVKPEAKRIINLLVKYSR
ncbi:hypothetical protein K8R66_00025 [bacterium]|nr:hypothetical protein [bacterium]